MAIDFAVKVNLPVDTNGLLREARAVVTELLGVRVPVTLEPADARLEPGAPALRLVVPGAKGEVAISLYEVPAGSPLDEDEPDESGWWAAFRAEVRTNLSYALALAAAIAYARRTGSRVLDEWGVTGKGRTVEPDVLLQSLKREGDPSVLGAADSLATALGLTWD
jgi:hypothetical protein